MDGEIYDDPVFRMACAQFEAVADHLEIPTDMRERLILPKRAVAVALPLHRDDGTMEVFQGFRVQHHLSLGPTKGGTRYSPTLNLGETAALSMWMSWKTALMNLPYGGAKGGIRVNPRDLSHRELEAISRRYMQEMIPFIGPYTDIPGPDMGTNEQVMAWFMDTYSAQVGYTVGEIVTGKPTAIGGCAGRVEATGRGVTFLVERAFEHMRINPEGKTAVVQGFGNVGSIAATALQFRLGMKVIGISDETCSLYNPDGIDLEKAGKHVEEHRGLHGFEGAEGISPEDFLTLPCDVLVPAAVDSVITEKNAGKLSCRILAEAANGPTTPAADKILEERWNEIFIIPDILCNAGGVTVSYFEWVQDLQNFFWTETEVMDRLYRILEGSFAAMIKRAKERKIPHRTAAMSIGVERVWHAKEARGLFP